MLLQVSFAEVEIVENASLAAVGILLSDSPIVAPNDEKSGNNVDMSGNSIPLVKSVNHCDISISGKKSETLKLAHI